MGEEDLFHFQVEDHGDFYELIITEPQVKGCRVSCLPVSKWCFLSPDAPTANPMEGHPRSSNGSGSQKRLHFDPTDQTKLSYSLKEFKKLGQITAPTSF